MPVHSLFLKYFHETCKTGSMRLAAKNLHVTSSALSRKISETEKELGTSLFYRSISGVSLTAAGKLMHEHVSETLHAYRQIENSINDLNDDLMHQITIAGPATVIPTYLPAVMSNFHEKHADVVTAFKGTSDIRVNRLLDDVHVDIILGFDLKLPKHGIEISRCPFQVGAIVSPEHPLASRSSMTFKECMAFPLILPDKTWPLRGQLDRVIRTENLTPDIVAASDSVELIRTLIVQEVGVGFATMLGVESELNAGKLIFIPIEGVITLTQDFVIIARDGLTETEVGSDLADLLISQLDTYQTR